MTNRYIPPGREDLYRRQAITDAEVKRLEAAHTAAERETRRLMKERDLDDPLVEDAMAEEDRLYEEWGKAQAVADRIYQERTAGLSYWIDTNTHLPVCAECGGTGGPRLAGGGIEDARTSCRTCRGWGREDDGRGHLPVWHEDDQAWHDPATGRHVEVPEPSLDEPPKKSEPPPRARPDQQEPPPMSMITNGRDLLLNAAQQLDDLAPHVSGDGDPEELGRIQQAEQLEAQADDLSRQATTVESPQAAAGLNNQAAELFMQAEQLRQQAKAGLEERSGVASMNMEVAEGIQGQIREAAGGTRTGDEMATAAAGIHAAVEESRTSLAGAAEMATDRKQTHECLGLIKQAQDHATVAAGMCGKLRGDIDQYVGALT